MKTNTIHTLVLCLGVLGSAACDQPKSGPVEPTATAAGAETTAKPAPASPSELFSTQGPGAPVQVGEAAQVTLRLHPGEGFKINKRYDWSFEFHPNDKVELATPSIGMDAVKLDDAEAVIPLAITAKSAGEHTLTATGNFSVCNDDKCELFRNREVTFTVAATDG